jgi:hypothetical protein
MGSQPTVPPVLVQLEGSYGSTYHVLTPNSGGIEARSLPSHVPGASGSTSAEIPHRGVGLALYYDPQNDVCTVRAYGFETDPALKGRLKKIMPILPSLIQALGDGRNQKRDVVYEFHMIARDGRKGVTRTVRERRNRSLDGLLSNAWGNGH